MPERGAETPAIPAGVERNLARVNRRCRPSASTAGDRLPSLRDVEDSIHHASSIRGRDMNITITCSSCGQKLSAPANLAGRRVPCPKCQAPVDAPATQPALEPAMAVPEVVREPSPRPAAFQPAPVPKPGLNPLPPSMPRRQGDDAFVDLGLSESTAPALAPRKRRSLRPALRCP